MIFLAPAKINLNLRITGKDKKDGYHFIKSVFDPVSLYDIIDIVPLNTPKIRVHDALAKLKIKQEKNLVYKAAALLQNESKTQLGADITLYKHIPDGAGLGGGSSDAAAVLKGLNKLWRLKYSAGKLKKLAVKLGSDVPFFIRARPALITGKGGIIKEIKRKTAYWYVIVVKKGVKISTPNAYKWFDIDKKLTLSQKCNILTLRHIGVPTNPILPFSIYNDFEAPVYRRKKVLKLVKDTLLKCGNATGVCMSGSGASVFALFTRKKHAVACYKESKRCFRGSFICLAHSI